MTSTGAITVIGEMLVDQFDSGPVVGGAPFNVERATEFAGRICEVRGAVPASLDSYAAWTAAWQTPAN